MLSDKRELFARSSRVANSRGAIRSTSVSSSDSACVLLALSLLGQGNVLDARRLSAVRVLAPDTMHLTPREMTALGLPRRLGARRSALLDRCRHMVAMSGDRAVGFAAFGLTGTGDLLVHELSAAKHAQPVVSALVTALELACLAAGGTRLLISSSVATPQAMLSAQGYAPAVWSGWYEKQVP